MRALAIAEGIGVIYICLVFQCLPAIPAYDPPSGGWTYIYTGDAAAGDPRTHDKNFCPLVLPALDGRWAHQNDSDEWNGDERGSASPPGGVESRDGVLTIEDAVYGMTRQTNNNRRIFFQHGLIQDGIAANNNVDTGVTLSFRTRLTPAA